MGTGQFVVNPNIIASFIAFLVKPSADAESPSESVNPREYFFDMPLRAVSVRRTPCDQTTITRLGSAYCLSEVVDPRRQNLTGFVCPEGLAD